MSDQSKIEERIGAMQLLAEEDELELLDNDFACAVLLRRLRERRERRLAAAREGEEGGCVEQEVAAALSSV